MIEIIPKPAQKLPLWQNILFYFSIAVLIASFLSYFVLGHFIKNSQKTLQELEGTLAREKTSSQLLLEEEVFNYQKKIADFSLLLRSHLFTSKTFGLLERNSHPKIWFFQFNLDSTKNLLVLSGEAEDFSVLGQQLLIFKKEPLIKGLDLSNISVGRKGRVAFILNFSLDPRLFKK